MRRATIAQSRHEFKQPRRQPFGLTGQPGAKPFADFVANCRAMGAVYADTVFGRRISQEASSSRQSDAGLQVVSGGRSQDVLPEFSGRRRPFAGTTLRDLAKLGSCNRAW